MKCSYCGTDKQTGDRCEKCGAPISRVKESDRWKSEPFFYNGYIVYYLREMAEDTFECQFWLGKELIERIRVSRAVLEEHIKLYEDSISFFWDLFLLAQGEKEVLVWQEKNTKYPAMFETRRIENVEKERLSSLSMRDLAHESIV
jgi:hypothetical protein